MSNPKILQNKSYTNNSIDIYFSPPNPCHSISNIDTSQFYRFFPSKCPFHRTPITHGDHQLHPNLQRGKRSSDQHISFNAMIDHTSS